jgi:hypothetical protein
MTGDEAEKAREEMRMVDWKEGEQVEEKEGVAKGRGS